MIRTHHVTRGAAVGCAALALWAAASVTLHAQPATPATRPAPPSAQLKDPKAADVTIVASVLEPRQLQATDENVARLKVPPGFRVQKFAENLKNPRMLAAADDGTVYATRRDLGDVILLRDADADGRADGEPRTVARREGMHGIFVHGDKVYLATVNEVYVADRNRDGTLGEPKRLISDLPDSGQHPNRTLAIGPDEMLYVSVGSTCNACDESSPESATMLRAKPDGTARTIFASGLRNTIGFGWHPATKQFWGMDHGIDWLGDDEQEEELNLLEQGKQYGWPYIYAAGKFNPQDDPPGELTMQQWREMSTEPALLYTPHAAPMQMAFYGGSGDGGSPFPAEYRNDAFVAMRGSWNRRPPSGYEVVRIDFDDGGKPTKIEPFLTGFLIDQGSGQWAHFGRLAGLAVARDGSLLVADDKNGVIYRIAYEGSQRTPR